MSIWGDIKEGATHVANVTGITHATKVVSDELTHVANVTGATDTVEYANDVIDHATRQIDKEWEKLEEGATEIAGVVTGDFAHDQKNIQNKQNEYEALKDKYQTSIEDLQVGLDRLSAYHDEIINLKGQREQRELKEQYEPELKKIAAEYTKMINDFNSDYHMVIKTLDDKWAKYLLWVPIIIGNIASDIGDAVLKGDTEALSRLGNLTIKVAELALLLFLVVISGGQSLWVTIPLIVATVASILDIIITVDSMYGQGLLMKGIFSCLDFLFNEVLHLDDVDPGLGTDKLSDEQYYSELTGYIQTALVITKTIAEVVAFHNMPEGFLADSLGVSAYLEEYESLAYVTEVTSSESFQVLYTIYQGSQMIGNISKKEEAYNALKEKLELKEKAIEERVVKMHNAKMVRAYKEEEDMLTYSSNQVSEYVMSGFDNPTSSFDPEMTIASNFGYRYNGSNIMDFVPEFTTDYDSLAGGPSYIDKILYKI